MQNQQLNNNYQQRENNQNNSAMNNYRNNHFLETETIVITKITLHKTIIRITIF